MVWPLTGH